ncbi:MAG: glutamine--fructose-6-phosphate transaminase (isomerizing) [Puniceicoccales bacterium]|jgi:glucosamine--fructose-6-phosphate aminotransferase (isomerizing)|nr:glutamine--fructose-6-phosphate transaminase (isomerizing) [Puniceicoccales bacterium]
MCGIIGYAGKHGAKDILLDGLKRLEYRGYDSAGVALFEGNELRTIRAVGTLDALVRKVGPLDLKGTVGIGHTRWATHGGITEDNAHPHRSSDGKISLVHNGVVENFAAIRTFLLSQGYQFSSETDSEVLANLIAYHYQRDGKSRGKNRFLESVRRALLHVQGTYGIAALCLERPQEMVGARNSSPLVLGIGDGECYLSSDAGGFAARTKDVVFLSDGELVWTNGAEFSLTNLGQERLVAKRQELNWDPIAGERNGYSHFMLKEIFEQPQALENAMRGRFSSDGSTAHFGGLAMTPRELRQVERIVLCACGTAYYACLTAEYFIETMARIPVEVEYASEFRYRNAPMDRHTLVLVVSQSGETLDTLEAMREARRKGFRVLAITNGIGSSIAREADGGIYQHAGPEIGVAATKSFTSQLCILAMLALYLGRLRDMSFDEGVQIVEVLKAIPAQAMEVLLQNEAILHIAERHSRCRDMLFLGRQALFPIALEGALKLKEVSYVHAEGHAAAEMKHGPIALITPDCPAFFLACDDFILGKTVSNIHEIRARGGTIIAVVTRGSNIPNEIVDDPIWIPRAHAVAKPILATIPLQLFACHMGILRGCDVDKPRNLAKSVTVE